MTSTALRVPDRATGPARPEGSRVLDRAINALVVRREAELELLDAAIEWAETHPLPVGQHDVYAEFETGSLYGEGICPLAGPGAPLVAEFAPDALAAALGWSVTAARTWMGDGLELTYRLPGLLDLVKRGVVPLHLARYATEHTRDLPLETAAHADRLLVQRHPTLTRHRIRVLVDEARLYHDPDRAVDAEEQALKARSVTLRPGTTPATTDVAMSLDTRDADAFDRALTRTAEALRRLGDGDDLDIRRARAVGVLADPARALELLEAGTDPGPTTAGQGKPAAVLWLHLDESAVFDLDMFAVPVTSDRYGTLSSDLVKHWLAGSNVVVRPVLDLHRTAAADQHDPPARMAEQVRLRDPSCVFPGCHHPSRACDLDHIEPYVPLDRGGPPGQTNPLNLAPLCRRHHRAKTHARWRYRRRDDGSYRWTSPTGDTYDVRPAPPLRVDPCSSICASPCRRT